MKHLRLFILSMLLVCLCTSMFVLTSCGRKEEGKMTVAARESVPAAEQEMFVPSQAPITEERTYYNFESDLNGWEIPMWVQGKTEYVATDVEISSEVANEGNDSMKINVGFPGGIWSAGLVEIEHYLNLSHYRVISADIYLPPDAPEGLKAKLILTVGNNWKFVEMSRSIPLMPGKWVTVTANIEPGSYDWKRVVPNEEFAADVRKIAIRIESNRKPAYTGPVYIDNIRCGR